MPFAFALLKGEVDLSECSRLAPKEKGDIAASLTKFDWREELIASLKEDVKKVHLDEISQKLGAKYHDGKLYFRCFGADVAVGPDGETQTQRALTPWMRMLILFYIKNGGSNNLSGKWVLHNELKGGMMKHKAFLRECEEPLKELLDRHFERASHIFGEFSARCRDEFATNNAWMVPVFPRLPVLLLYWPRDDEFDSQVTIRFDSTADSCFDVEQLIFLVEELIKDIEAAL
jgi:hypothetical protein